MIASTLLAAASCAVAFRFASACLAWSKREGYWAAGLLAFSLIFYLPAATIPLEPDTLDDPAAFVGDLFGMAGKSRWLLDWSRVSPSR